MENGIRITKGTLAFARAEGIFNTIGDIEEAMSSFCFYDKEEQKAALAFIYKVAFVNKVTSAQFRTDGFGNTILEIEFRDQDDLKTVVFCND